MREADETGIADQRVEPPEPVESGIDDLPPARLAARVVIEVEAVGDGCHTPRGSTSVALQ